MTNDTQDFIQRIEELETKVMFQDDTLEQLNQSLITQQKSINQLTQLIEKMSQQLEDLDQPNVIESNQETPPPHY
jgi:SlyX protein